MTISEVKSQLIKVAKKIDKIEDTDSDYAKNKKWQELRQKQDNLFGKLARLQKPEAEAENVR